ncbi:hypothetical protein [Paenibacillus sp.]|uniref:PilN domain-containing protein n=1 Tax=Paenibacillus sp. TaxID=58172 RepID=UPI002D571799|nr:hypothetical protein [Paenibacillus sp.]HZG56049.1 hypothetical protein [Paenibacillus sp.]
MRAINLLPRKPFWVQWFGPLLAGILCMYLMIGAAMVWATWSNESAHRSNKAETEALLQQMQALREDRVPDPAMNRFAAFQEVVGALESSRYDWVPVLEGIVGRLPAAARITNASYDPESARVALETEFKSLTDAAAYVGALRAEPLFSSANVTGIEAAQASPVADESTEPGETVVEASPLLRYELSADDPALRELEWIILRQAIAQQEGIALPVESPYETPSAYPELEGTFTPAEIEEAREAVRRQQSNGEPDAPLPEAEAAAVPYYRVQLSLGVAGVEPIPAEAADAAKQGGGPS